MSVPSLKTSASVAHGAADQERPGFPGLEEFGRVFLCSADGGVSAGAVSSAAQRIAAEIDRKISPDAPVMLLLRRRGIFVAALCAALDRGRRVLLPHDNSESVVDGMKGIEPDLVSLTDDRPIFVGMCKPGVARPPAEGTFLNPSPGPLLQFFTSGSTGSPVQHERTWDELAHGGRAWRNALALDGRGTIVATVPPQHMYGMEASVVLPLTGPDIAVWDGQPLFPEDVRGALEKVPDSRILVTTPVHLNALVRSQIALPGLHRIVSATAPLTEALALRAEEQWDVPVLDIYGSTETGMIACRRPARTDIWRLREDVEVRIGESAFVVEGAGFPGQVTLAVQAESVPGGFRLHRREDDLVNVAGRRASLSGLSAILQGLDGVDDGVFWVPEDSDPEQFRRPVAFVVTETLSEEDVRRQLRGQVVDTFIPRRIVRLPALPRNSTGKVTQAVLSKLWREHMRSDGHGS